MNKRTLAINISKHPIIKTLLEQRMATTSEVARLIVEELLDEEELGQKKYEGQIQQLTKLVTSTKFTNFSGRISKFLKTKPKGLDAFVANMGTMDPQQLLEVLGDTKEWFKDRKVQIEKEAKAGKLDYAAFLLQGEFKKWEAQYKEAYEAYNTATGASESGKPDQKSYNKFRAIVLVWQDMFKSAVTLIKAAQNAEEEPPVDERKKLVEALLKAKDIKTFLAIYKKLAGEDYKDQFTGTVKVVKTLIELKKQLSDNPDELLEKGMALLDKDYIEKKLYMDLEKISEKIRDKIFELVTDIKLDKDREKFMKQPFENLLLDLRKVGDMRKKLEVISKRFPEFMTPNYGLKTLDDLDEYKNLFMALVGGRTMEKGALDEDDEKPSLPGQKEARQFLIGIIAYYKLSEKESYEKIKANDERYQKELQRIMKAADHMETFNKPLADALRKFVEELSKKSEEDCIALLKKLIEMFTSKYDLDEKAFAQLTVKIFEVAFDQEFENDEEKKNILEKFNSTLKPFIEEFSEKIDKFVKMYEDDIEKCKEKVDALKDVDVPKYKIAIFFTEYREILEKMGEEPPEEPPEEEQTEEEKEELKELQDGAAKTYEKAWNDFRSDFLTVKTLHRQSEVYRLFYDAVAVLTGMNMDKIVGEQIAAYTKTARPDQLQEQEKEENQEIKKLSKNVGTNAQIIERHANAILEILSGYEKYLNIASKARGAQAGVEQGSRELFNKFGEGNPKKLLYKFVKLIVKDIDSTESNINKLIAEIEQEFGDKPQEDEKQVQTEDLLREQQDVRALPVKEKILLVQKTYDDIETKCQDLLDMITKAKTPDEKAAEKPKDKSAEEEPEVVGEAPTQRSDSTINPNPTGTDDDPKDMEDRRARTGQEVQGGYDVLAKDIFKTLKVIRPLFPTSQPFDSEYGFSAAQAAFKAALKGLASSVAKVQRYSFDQLTSERALTSFLQKIQGFREVIKDIFGFSQEAKDAEKKAAFSEEGENSGMPFDKDGEDKEATGEKEEPAENIEQLKEKLDKTISDYEKYISIALNLLTMPREISKQLKGARGKEAIQFLDGHFEAIVSSKKGIIPGNLAGLETSFSQSKSQINRIQSQFTEIIKKEFDNNQFKKADQVFDKLQGSIIDFLKKIIAAKTGPKPNEKSAVNEAMVSAGRMRDIGRNLSSAVASYYIFKVASQAIEEDQLKELELDKFEERIKEFVKNVEESSVRIKNSYEALEGDSEKIRFYKMFFNMRVLGVTKIKDDEKETGGDTPDDGSPSGDTGKRKKPPESPAQGDFQREKEPSRRKQAARRAQQSGRLEETLINKLKPIIKEMLKKGK